MTHHTKRKRTYKRAPTRTIVVQQSTPAAPPPPPTTIIVRYVSVSAQTDELQLVQTRKKVFNMPQLESVNRITNLPIVETGINYAENVYQKIKQSNSLVNWTLAQAENTLHNVVDSAGPAIVLLQGPISQVDKIFCKTLDIVEEKIPSINLPPEMIYWNTKQYAKNTVSTKIVKPVLKRADSVKQIGNTVLSSKYTAYAADTLDGALYVADKYVDKYLPADDQDRGYDEVDKPVDGPAGKAIHTIQHVDRLGRKLKRRLTKRTLLEVKALREQSAEAVHVLIYVAELIATDPVLAFQKGKELWASLSKDEPENQARPENLEQLCVLLTRESARRVVHLVNFTASVVNKINQNVTYSVLTLANKFLGAADTIAKTVHLEKVQHTTASIIRSRAYAATVLLKQLNIQLTDILSLQYQLDQHLAQPENIDQLRQVLPILWQLLSQGHIETSLEVCLKGAIKSFKVEDNWAQQLSHQPQELNKAILSVPQIKIQQLKAFHTNAIRTKNGFEHNTNPNST